MKPDEGYEETERLIKRLEARIKDEYKQANKEVLEKYNDYMRRFKVKDDIKRKAVEAGVLKKEDYIKWRQSQITVGKRWKALVDQLADDYHLANAKAVSISQGYQAEAYAVNHNFATYSIEQQARIDTSYTLYNRDTVERMIRDDPELLPPPKPGGETARKLAENKDLIWNRQKISSAIVQGVLQGESIPKIANRLEAVGEMNHKAAIRNARTMMTGAQNAGRVAAMKRAKAMGIGVVNVWSAALDMRTRHEHRELDGQKREVGEPFVVPSSGEKILYPGDPDAAAHLVYNCFVGDTKIATDSDIVRSYKSDYSGQLVTIETASGVQFTCTPNHPILTPDGWVGAALLNNGDNLLVASSRNISVFRRQGNIKHIHARFKALYNALHCFGFVSRDSSLGVNFHGDIPTTNVEIITKEWKLRRNRDTGRRNCIDKILFKDTNKTLVSKSATVQHFWRVCLPSFRIMSRLRQLASFLRRCLSHPVIHCFGSVARCQSSINNASPDRASVNVDFLRNSLYRFPGKVFVDNIIDIEIKTVRHIPVFNLQTKNSLYFVNTIIPHKNQKRNGNFAIAHNCRCALVPQIKGFEYDIRKDQNLDLSQIDGMSYAQWKKNKTEKPNKITLPEEKAAAIKGGYVADYKALRIATWIKRQAKK